MKDFNKVAIGYTVNGIDSEIDIIVINDILERITVLENEYLEDNNETIDIDCVELIEDEYGLEINYTYNSAYTLTYDTWENMEQYQNDIKINSLANDGKYNVMLSHDNDDLTYIIYLGEHSEGIFTIMKSNNQRNIIDKLERLLSK